MLCNTDFNSSLLDSGLIMDWDCIEKYKLPRNCINFKMKTYKLCSHYFFIHSDFFLESFSYSNVHVEM